MNASPLDWTDPQPFKLRIADVELLEEAGALDERPRVELIEGMLIAMSPQQRPHVFVKNELTFRFRLALAALHSPLSALCEATVEMSSESAPEPDVILTDAPKGAGYVPVGSLALAIEVADTSLRFDLGRKRRLYAAAGVPEYWVIDVKGAEVHRFADPSDGAYRAEPPIPLAGDLQSLTMTDLRIDGSGIL